MPPCLIDFANRSLAINMVKLVVYYELDLLRLISAPCPCTVKSHSHHPKREIISGEKTIINVISGEKTIINDLEVHQGKQVQKLQS